MRWKRAKKSENVEDRRGASPATKATLFGGGAIAVIVAIVAQFIGIDPSKAQAFVKAFSKGKSAPVQSAPANLTPAEKEAGDFCAHVLGDTEETWRQLFSEMGKTYQEPSLVLFRDRVDTNCGQQGSNVGPFYCPGDSKLYIDLTFYKTLADRLGAQGDFAQAYVIAHEVGHHVQKLLGDSAKIQGARRRMSETEGNKLLVGLELQADYYAGVWAHHAKKRGLLEPGDLEEAINAAFAVGDDTLQKNATGTVRPESFTHGTSEQRMQWFQRGYRSGDPEGGFVLTRGR